MLGCASVPVQPGIQGHHPHRQADQTLLTTVIQGSVNALKVEPGRTVERQKVSLRIRASQTSIVSIWLTTRKQTVAEAGSQFTPGAELQVVVVVRAIGVETKNDAMTLIRGFLVGEVVLCSRKEVARLVLKGHAIDSWEDGAAKPDRKGQYGDPGRDRDRERYDDRGRDRDRDGRDRDRVDMTTGIDKMTIGETRRAGSLRRPGQRPRQGSRRDRGRDQIEAGIETAIDTMIEIETETETERNAKTDEEAVTRQTETMMVKIDRTVVESVDANPHSR